MIGAGSVAVRHAGVLSGFPDVEVVAVADPVQLAAEQLAASCGAASYTDPEVMLDRQRLDAVYVCVPPYAHGRPERAALARRLPLFVEKPVAADLDTAESIGALVAEAGVPTATGYHWRCLDLVDQARLLLAERPARLAMGFWLDKVPPPGWWVSRARSGGQVVEQLTHVVDLARTLVGEVEAVFAQASRTPQAWRGRPEADVDDVSVASLRFRSGALGTLAATCLLPRAFRTELHTVSAGLALQISDRELVVDDGAERSVYHPRVDPKELVDREFMDVLRGDRPAARVPYAEALRSHRVACAVARSALSGELVHLAGAGALG